MRIKVILANPPWRVKAKDPTGKEYERLGIRAGSRWPFSLPKKPKGGEIPDYLPYPFF